MELSRLKDLFSDLSMKLLEGGVINSADYNNLLKDSAEIIHDIHVDYEQFGDPYDNIKLIAFEVLGIADLVISGDCKTPWTPPPYEDLVSSILWTKKIESSEVNFEVAETFENTTYNDKPDYILCLTYKGNRYSGQLQGGRWYDAEGVKRILNKFIIGNNLGEPISSIDRGDTGFKFYMGSIEKLNAVFASYGLDEDADIDVWRERRDEENRIRNERRKLQKLEEERNRKHEEQRKKREQEIEFKAIKKVKSIIAGKDNYFKLCEEYERNPCYTEKVKLLIIKELCIDRNIRTENIMWHALRTNEGEGGGIAFSALLKSIRKPKSEIFNLLLKWFENTKNPRLIDCYLKHFYNLGHQRFQPDNQLIISKLVLVGNNNPFFQFENRYEITMSFLRNYDEQLIDSLKKLFNTNKSVMSIGSLTYGILIHGGWKDNKIFWRDIFEETAAQSTLSFNYYREFFVSYLVHFKDQELFDRILHEEQISYAKFAVLNNVMHISGYQKQIEKVYFRHLDERKNVACLFDGIRLSADTKVIERLEDYKKLFGGSYSWFENKEPRYTNLIDLTKSIVDQLNPKRSFWESIKHYLMSPNEHTSHN